MNAIPLRAAIPRLFAAFTLTVMAGACAPATREDPPLPISVTTADDPASQAIGAELSRVFTPIAEDHDLAGVIRVERGDAVVAEAIFGYADAETFRPNRMDTLFDTGSVTKSFTATLILLLEQDGHLDLDAKVSEYLPGHAIADRITVRQVLMHRAGLPRDIPDEDKTIVEREGLLAWLDRQELLFEPGTDEAYSNTGYQLLAELVEAISGRGYADVLRTQVFAPAGLEGAGVSGATPPPGADIATLYEPGPSPIGIVEPAGTFVSKGDSGILLSAAELIDWIRTVNAGTVADLMPEGEAPIGNVHVQDYDGITVIRQQGTSPGSGAGVVLWPDKDLAVAYTLNISSYPLWGLEPALFRIARGETLSDVPARRPEPVALDESHRQLAGRYAHPQFGPLAISENPDGMMLTVEALGFDFYLTPLAEGALLWRTFNTRFSPLPDGTGLAADMQLIGSPRQEFTLDALAEKTVSDE